MKYPRFLQILTISAVVVSAVPLTDVSVHAADGKETPKEYEARTEYSLPKGYHYVLEDEKYVVFDEDGKVVIEKDKEKKAEPQKSEEKKAAVKKAEEKKKEEKEAEPEKEEAKEAESEEASEKDTKAENSDGAAEEESSTEEANASESAEAADKAENAEGTEQDAKASKDSEAEAKGNTALYKSDSDDAETEIYVSDVDGDVADDANGENNGQNPGEAGDENGEQNPDGSEGETGEQNPDGTGGETGEQNPDGTGGEAGEQNPDGISGETGEQNPGEAIDDAEPEDKTGLYSEILNPGVQNTDKDAKKTYNLKKPDQKKTKKLSPEFKASKPFAALYDRICYNVEVPIEGIPSFITQEMVVGALKAQDETGYPASVTIAQIINESGYGKYGPGGDNGQGLSYLAYQYCNLFGIKGTGTAGSAVMSTREMTPDGTTYSIHAGFRAYYTYTECIEDRSELLGRVYSDLTANVTDANTFAMNISGRWATSINYGQNLIKTMETYDLYRLDDMTLIDFNEMIGTFANPCPGAHITSTFGYREFDDKFHKGLDMGTGSENIPTYAAEAGTVTFAGSAGAAGNLIIINHGDGLVTKYMHHSQIYVKMGQKVEKGQQIGLSGTTGRSTGNHLHFQVEKNGVAMNPAIYLTDEKAETVAGL